MSCNTCAKSFGLLRKEKGCPSCGFSYCSKCLDSEVFLQKLNSKVKVCRRCMSKLATSSEEPSQIEPPDAYYKRTSALKDPSDDSKASTGSSSNNKDQEILLRLNKLKEDRESTKAKTEEIESRLHSIKGDTNVPSETELQERLAKLRGVPLSTLQSKPILFTPDTRTEQEQADELMKQYLDQVKIDGDYKVDFDGVINNMDARLQKLKGQTHMGDKEVTKQDQEESEDEETIVKRIIQKAKDEAVMDQEEISPNTNDELPFCEICNEDAVRRCLGCKYLFCKRCFLDHKDDDDGCNRYEPYTPPKKI